MGSARKLENPAKLINMSMSVPKGMKAAIHEICSYLYASASEFARAAFMDKIIKDLEYLKTFDPVPIIEPIPAPGCIIHKGKQWFISEDYKNV